MRLDHAIIDRWIKPGARVLDLGCGDGTLLQRLQQSKKFAAMGWKLTAPTFSAVRKKASMLLSKI